MTNEDLTARMRKADGSLQVVVAVMAPDGTVAKYPVTDASVGPADYGQEMVLSVTTATEA